MPEDSTKPDLQGSIPPWKHSTEDQGSIAQEEQVKGYVGSKTNSSSHEIPKTKRGKLKTFIIIASVLVILFITPFIIAFGFLFFNLFQNVTNTLPVSNKIERPGIVFLENNNIYIIDSGDHQTYTPGFRFSKQVIWIYEYPSGRFLDQISDTDRDYQKIKKSVREGYEKTNLIDLGPFNVDEIYEITNSATNKRYTLEGKGIGVYDSSDKKLKELPYKADLIFNGPAHSVYFIIDSTSTLYKIDSRNDTLIFKKKIPVPNPEFGVGVYVDFSPYVTKNSAFFLPKVYNSSTETTELIIYDFMKDDFLKKVQLSGDFGSVFANGNDIFVSSTREGPVVWVDKQTGKIKRTFRGK
jgi:hypothetical protein